MRLPTGTVTFLFTDVEGSTRLLQEHGDAYGELLAEHRRTLRDAFARNGGVEVDTQGDAFFVAFERASDAVAAAAEAREALAAGPVRVRIGLHTGEPVLTEEGYVGMDVHRAARIAAVGHGGQVLLSQATRDLAGVDGLRDLGEHRLKDLSTPERIWQLGDGEFPPLKSLFQTNLPVQPTPLVGRRRELSDVVELLRLSRVVTLTGPGGSGKTRLALEAAAQAAERHVDGVWFVSLAAVFDPALVEPTIAQVLGVQTELAEHLAGRDALLVLDNMEQLLPEAAAIVSSLPSTLVVTSRERLNIAGEQEYPVPTLPLDEGVELFVQRARQLRPDFQPDAEVASIVRRLDGLPLAVELAAARVKVLPPGQIVTRLGKSLDLLTSGAHDAPERQRTLRATIEWSYDLLDEDERLLFARLSVFAGSFDVEGAEAVAGADLDTLGSLVDKSLLRQSGPARFFMLETIREYASERVEDLDALDALCGAHAAFYVDVAGACERGLRTSAHARWLARLDAERDNMRAALETLLDRGDERALRLASSLWRFWEARGATEGRRWLRAALALDEAPPFLCAPCQHALARLAFFQGDYEEAIQAFGNAIELARESGDSETLILALGKASWVHDERGEPDRALALAEEALHLAQGASDPWVRAEAFNDVGSQLLNNTDDPRAKELLEESLALRRALGDAQNVADSLNNLGWLGLVQGSYADARRYLEESVRLARDLQDEFHTALALDNLGLVALFEGDFQEAVALLAESVRICGERGDRRVGAEALLGLAGAVAGSGGDALAVKLSALAEQLLVSMEIETWPVIREHVDPMLANARARLDADALRVAAREGQTLTLEQAADEAVRLEPQRRGR